MFTLSSSLEWQERLRVLNDALQSLIDERRYRPSGELYAPGSNVMPLSAIGSAAWLTPPQPTSLGWAGPSDPLAFTSAPAQCATVDFNLTPGVPADMPRLDSVPSALPAAGQPSPSVTHGRRKRRAKVAVRPSRGVSLSLRLSRSCPSASAAIVMPRVRRAKTHDHVGTARTAAGPTLA